MASIDSLILFHPGDTSFEVIGSVTALGRFVSGKLGFTLLLILGLPPNQHRSEAIWHRWP